MDFYIDQTIHASPEDVARVMFDPDREAEWMAFEPDRRLEMEIVGPSRSRHGVIIYQVVPTAGGAIATIHVRDDEVGPHPISGWARKQQAQENLAGLPAAIARLRA